MLLKHRSLIANLALLAALIGLPYAGLWGWLLAKGQVDMTTVGWVAGLLVIDTLLLAHFLRDLLRPMRDISWALRHMAEGDYTVRLDNRYGGELGEMLSDFNRSAAASREAMGLMLDNTVNIATASFQTGAAAAKVVENAEEEESHAHSISGAGDQISAAVGEIAANAEEANVAAQDATEAVDSGAQTLQETVGSMKELAGTVEQAAEKIGRLGNASERVGEVSSVINEIAEQTNLLALNAAIEAARAGEHGRGFAVVADEVRSLAERTSGATGEIAETIRTIQEEIAEVTQTMQAGVSQADTSREASVRTGEAVEQLRSRIESVSALIAQIASAAEQQRAGTTEIARNIRSIAALASGNTQYANEAVDVVESTNRAVQKQLEAFDRFEIPNKAIVVAKSDHVMWKKRLTEMLLGRLDLKPEQVTDHHACRFGKWYYNEGKQLFGHLPAFEAIEAPHQEVHATAKQIAELHHVGDRRAAQALLEQLDEPTHQVLACLDQLREAVR